METALDALPGRPLAPEDVAAINNAATLRVIPYTWLGDQVIAALLLHDERSTDGDVGEAARVTDGEEQPTTTDEPTENPFGRDDRGIGTVEVIDEEEIPETQVTTADSTGTATQESDSTGTTQDDDLHVYAVGYDDEAESWIVIAEIDPDAEFVDAEPPIREWASETYHDAIVERLAIGPSEYEI